MIKMDFKGIAWVGNVYQKFEAMCLEVEEVMYEDTVKFVGNQVQTVGESVKKFYSEVMQDVLPQSCIDPVKEAAVDLSVNPYAEVSIHKKPKAKTDVTYEPNQNSSMELFLEQNRDMGSKGKPMGITKRISQRENNLQSEGLQSFTPVSKDLNRVPTCCEMGKYNDVATDQIDAELCTNKRSDCSRVGNFDYVGRTIVSTADCSRVGNFDYVGRTIVSTADMSLSSESSQGPALVPSPEINDTCGIDETGSMIGSYISCDPMNSESGCEDSFPTGDANVDFIESDDDIAELRTESIQEFDKSNCVVVGRDDLSLAAPKENNPMSYKRKIRKALLSKGSARKQEYKQLAVQHCCLNTGTNEEVHDNSMPVLMNEEKLPPHRISESEWEIL